MSKKSLLGIFIAVFCVFALAGSAVALETSAYTGFMSKAVAYKPVPIGEYSVRDQHGGAQLCYDVSPAPWGDAGGISPCYDSDYFGYMTDTSGGVLDDSFKKIWARDLAVFKEMGVNTVRLYDTNPQFRSHKEFLDVCQAAGIKVVYPLWLTTETMNPNWPVENSDKTGPEDYRLPYMVGIRMQVAEVGSHPAILAFVAGNEVHAVPAIPSQQHIIDRIKMAMAYVKANSSIPVTTCPPDLGDSTANWQWYLDTFTDADLVMVNAGYRGDACTTSNSYSQLWDIVANIVAPTGKAFYLGEYGVHDPDDASYSRRHFNCFLQSADENKGRTNFMGVAFFEYIDEADKPANQKEMGVLAPVLATTSVSSRTADNLTKKTSSYSKLGAGRWEMFQPAGSGDPAAASYNYHEIWN